MKEARKMYQRKWRLANLEIARGYAKKHYRKKRTVILAKDKKVRTDRVKMLQHLKGTTPCADCGRQYAHYVMEFDHRVPPKRYGNGRRYCIGALCGVKNMEAELAKCGIVCANCHCRRTWLRKMGAKLTPFIRNVA